MHFAPFIAAASERGEKRTLEVRNAPRTARERTMGEKCTRPRSPSMRGLTFVRPAAVDAGEGVHGTEQAGYRIVTPRETARDPLTATRSVNRSVRAAASRRAVRREGLSRTETSRPA